MEEIEKEMSMEEIRAYVEKQKEESQENKEDKTASVVEVREERKSITEISAKDIKVKFDDSKSMEEQAEDVVGAMATANAVQDEQTAKALTDKKAEELLAKAETKKKEAKTAETEAEVRQQEANRSKYEAVLQTFCINKHLPDWLLKIMVIIFSPIFIALSLVIGIPCGAVKVLIDNIDNILVTYENAESKGKRKIKATVWIAIIIAVLVATAITVLKATKVI